MSAVSSNTNTVTVLWSHVSLCTILSGLLAVSSLPAPLSVREQVWRQTPEEFRSPSNGEAKRMEMGNVLCFSLAGRAGVPPPRSREAEHHSHGTCHG